MIFNGRNRGPIKKSTGTTTMISIPAKIAKGTSRNMTEGIAIIINSILIGEMIKNTGVTINFQKKRNMKSLLGAKGADKNSKSVIHRAIRQTDKTKKTNKMLG